MVAKFTAIFLAAKSTYQVLEYLTQVCKDEINTKVIFNVILRI